MISNHHRCQNKKLNDSEDGNQVNQEVKKVL